MTAKVVKRISQAEVIRLAKKHGKVTLVVNDVTYDGLIIKIVNRRRELYSNGQCYYWHSGVRKRDAYLSCFYFDDKLRNTVQKMYEHDRNMYAITAVVVGKETLLKVKL